MILGLKRMLLAGFSQSLIVFGLFLLFSGQLVALLLVSFLIILLGMVQVKLKKTDKELGITSYQILNKKMEI